MKRFVILLILGIIAWNLSRIGWTEVLRSLPRHPGFYLIFFLLYLSLPFAEVFIYRQVWQFRRWLGFRAFLNKRIYNNEVVGYSGEFYLYLWAKKKLNLPGKVVMRNIRDSNILSALVSYFVAFTLVGLLVFTDAIVLSDWFENVDWFFIALGVLIAIVLIGVGIQFRRHLFALPLGKALRIFMIYLVRFVFHHAGLVAMWALAMPGAPLQVWLTFVAMYIVINRLPFFPSKDLVFALAGIELSRVIGVNPAEVAGMLLVYSALNKVANMTLFSVLSLKLEKLQEEEGKP
ncbi:MAG: hypothetical protein LAT52_06135 [Balneolales bacterium]|nr:hypothetical protein [Balneolales bacterium]